MKKMSLLSAYPSENVDSFSNDEISTDSFSNDEIDTAETNMELDWYFPWRGHRWFHPRPWLFAHPPKPAGGFRHKFPHWPFGHPPKPAGMGVKRAGTGQPGTGPSILTGLRAGLGARRTGENSESENPDSFDEIDTESNMELDWWFPWYRHRWFHPRPWPFVHPPMPSGGFRHKFPYHPWPKFKHPPMSSLVPFPPIGERT
ncbi:hypothetical protein FXO38_26655 [Capsicum annuum]|nr:hypothetical protein FXO38_26655 [Capsicum annuum]